MPAKSPPQYNRATGVPHRRGQAFRPVPFFQCMPHTHSPTCLEYDKGWLIWPCHIFYISVDQFLWFSHHWIQQMWICDGPSVTPFTFYMFLFFSITRQKTGDRADQGMNPFTANVMITSAVSWRQNKKTGGKHVHFSLHHIQKISSCCVAVCQNRRSNGSNLKSYLILTYCYCQ